MTRSTRELRPATNRRTAACVVVPHLLVLLAAACEGAPPDAATPVARDSAGIRIVENSAQVIAAAPVWRLAAEPIVDIGVIEGAEEYRLFGVTDVKPLSAEEIAVVNGGSREIRIYDWSGRFRRSFGGEGEGPGEFRWPSNLLRFAPDSLGVWDSRLMRLSFFTAAGEFVRQVMPSRAAANPMVPTVFQDGSFLVSDERMVIPESGFAESPLTLVHYARDGAFLDSAGVYSLGLFGRLGQAQLVGGPIFSARAVVGGNEASFWVGTGDAYEITRHSPSGSVLQLVRWEGPELTVSAADVDAYWEQQMEGVTGDRRRRLEHLRQIRPVADRFPTLDRIVIDDLHRVWVQQYRRPRNEGPDTWWVFDETGAFVAHVEIPEALLMTTVSEAGLFGVERDSLDVEHVRAYRIEER